MNNAKFFSSFSLPSEEYTLPNGDVIALTGMSVGERQKWLDVYNDDPKRSSAMLIIFGCDFLCESDEEEVAKMPATESDEIAAIVLRLSGMDDVDDVEKKDSALTSDSSTD